MKSIQIVTAQHSEFINITGLIQNYIDESEFRDGICVIHIPHTTAGVTVNENADPDVTSDLLYLLDKNIPWKDRNYHHFEGNTAAHLKASLMGNSTQIFVENGKLQLGRWQGIYFCEFDGPRNREIWIKFLINN
jgi:secondary thiamine-phosphate synthase enzyme